MASVQQTLEIERIINLARGFDWEKTSEVVEGDKIILTIEKTIQSPAPPESEA